MAKFGDIINTSEVVLIGFYNSNSLSSNNYHFKTLQSVSASLANRGKVVKIDISKNTQLVDALQIKSNPTYFAYKNGVLKWRRAGKKDVTELMDVVGRFLK